MAPAQLKVSLGQTIRTVLLFQFSSDFSSMLVNSLTSCFCFLHLNVSYAEARGFTSRIMTLYSKNRLGRAASGSYRYITKMTPSAPPLTLKDLQANEVMLMRG